MRKLIITIALFVVLISLVAAENQITGNFIDVTGNYVASTGSFTIENIAPVLETDDEIIGAEGDLITLSANASDANGDEVTIYYGLPFNTSGQWQTEAGDGGIYLVNVIASDSYVNTTETVTVKIAPYCGDGNCTAGETCSSCASDCGQCAAVESGNGRSRGAVIDTKTVEIPHSFDHNEESGEEEGKAKDTGQEQSGSLGSEKTEGPIKIKVQMVTEKTSEKLRFKINLRKALNIKEKGTIKITVRYAIIPIETDNAALTGAATYEECICDAVYVYEEVIELKEDEVNLVKEIIVPEYLKSGRYKLMLIADYQGNVAVEESEFEIEKIGLVEMPSSYNALTTLLIILGVGAYILFWHGSLFCKN
ncbi:hypothetical protein KY337_05765 [Candidatus Woesearchaeota archaeon]|nr:hypothetical protein [Candidatus Woesearchaeota archaeon]